MEVNCELRNCEARVEPAHRHCRVGGARLHGPAHLRKRFHCQQHEDTADEPDAEQGRTRQAHERGIVAELVYSKGTLCLNLQNFVQKFWGNI